MIKQHRGILSLANQLSRDQAQLLQFLSHPVNENPPIRPIRMRIYDPWSGSVVYTTIRAYTRGLLMHPVAVEKPRI